MRVTAPVDKADEQVSVGQSGVERREQAPRSRRGRAAVNHRARTRSCGTRCSGRRVERSAKDPAAFHARRASAPRGPRRSSAGVGVAGALPACAKLPMETRTCECSRRREARRTSWSNFSTGGMVPANDRPNSQGARASVSVRASNPILRATIRSSRDLSGSSDSVSEGKSPALRVRGRVSPLRGR